MPRDGRSRSFDFLKAYLLDAQSMENLTHKTCIFHPMTPPRMPTVLQDLDRATMLLGHMAKGPVKQKFLREVEQLLGELPHPDVVVEWKTALKQHRKDVACKPPTQNATIA